MASEECIKSVKEAGGGALDDESVEAIFEAMDRRAQVRGPGSADDPRTAALKDAEALAAEARMVALIEKRNRLLNHLAEQRRKAQLAIWEDDPGLGLRAMNVGVNTPREGARLSVDARKKAIEAELFGGLVYDLRRAGLDREFASGRLSRDIARELWEIRSDGTGRPGISGNSDARKIADIVHKYQEAARQRMNRAGAWVGSIDGYITRQSHDPVRMRRAGYEAWRNNILPKLDIEQTFQGADPEPFLRSVYDGLESGVHMKVAGDQSDRMYAFRGPANLAKRASQERTLHFKSADAWLDYNQAFGMRDLNESIIQSLTHAARTVSVMEVWGTNPEVAWQNTLEELRAAHRNNAEIMKGIGRDKAAARLRQAEFDEITGKSSIPGIAWLANAGAVTRGIESLARLGGAVISSITDVPVLASELRYQGHNLLQGYGEAFANLLRGRGDAEQRKIADLLGAGIEGMVGAIGSRFSATDHVPGTMSKLMRHFFRLNGLTWWTDAHKTGVGLMMSRSLAMERHLDFGALDAPRRRLLELYGIDAARWDVIREHAVHVDGDGREFIVPSALRQAADDIGDRLLSGEQSDRLGRMREEFRPAAQERMRQIALDDLTSRLSAYFADRIDYAVVTPGARERAMMLWSTQPGTPEGETLRFVMQFKAFPIAFLSRVVGRELRGGASPDISGLVHLMVAGTVFGYLAMAAKDLTKGKTPRDPTDPGTWAAAFVQGGGAGIYGDFLLGSKSRFGQGVLDTFLGPAWGSLNEAADVFARTREWVSQGLPAGKDAAPQAIRFAINHAPLLNLFYARMAIDYLFLYQIQEALNPGFLRRFEKRVQEENAQTFYLRPSAAIPYGGGGRLLEGVR